MLPDKIAFVDIETTGARPMYDKVLEIGILRIENNKLVKTYQSLFNPNSYISPFIENLTGISQRDVENAPTFYDEMENILEILDGCVFAAHNVRFDYGFLRNEIKRNGSSFTSKHFCTVRLSQLLYPQFSRHDLDHIIKRFHVQVENRHRAFDDARVLWEFYQKVQQEVPKEKLIAMLNLAMKRPSRPLNISEEILEQLPESPGVYIFLGADHDNLEIKENQVKSEVSSKQKNNLVPLYIGKSINIRERVLSHFANDALSGTDMQLSQEVQDIETIVTGGELSALFKESTLVKQMQPLYNRKLRLSQKLTVLQKNQTDEGYDTVDIQTIPSINAINIENIYGIVRSKKQAKNILLDLAKEHSLCHKLLGLEKTKGGCFAYRLGWCRGACVGKESPLSYNVRIIEAFGKIRIKPWPFDGPILIEEENHLDEVKEIFIVDKWCVLGSFRNNTDILDFEKSDYIFDLDAYKILKTFLRSPKNLLKIKEANTLSCPNSNYPFHQS